MQPAHVIAGEILEFDGAFDVNRLAAVSHYITVSRLLRSGKVDDAVAQAETAVTLDPGSLNAREALTSAYAARHQPDDATREFQAAMRLYGTVPPEFASTVSRPVNPLVSPQQ